MIVDDHDEPACRKEVEAFRAERGIAAPLERVDGSAVAWRKAAVGRDAVGATTRAGRRRAHVRRSRRRRPTDALDLSVVVVFYNMRREAARTLHSLSRAYQEGIDDLDYEVIVVENGSDADQRLGEEFVESFGPEFRYLDLGADADAVAGRGAQPRHPRRHAATRSRS